MHMPMPTTSNFEEIHQASCMSAIRTTCAWTACGSWMRPAATTILARGWWSMHKRPAGISCWLIFDAHFRAKFTAGTNGGNAGSQNSYRLLGSLHLRGHLGGARSQDRSSGRRAQGDRAENERGCARAGKDPEFGRGGNDYDRFFGDPTSKPNPSLGTIEELRRFTPCRYIWGLGTKGGLKADARARVLDGGGRPISNLYAQAMRPAVRSATATPERAAPSARP